MAKVAILQFPGTNCEYETRRVARAAETVGMEADFFRWNDDYKTLRGYDGIIIPGGFSYEDRGRAGIVAAMDPVMGVVREMAEEAKPVLGICNGAQILVESRMVPGIKGGELEMALARNKQVKDGEVLGTGYYNPGSWTYVVSSSNMGRTAFTQSMDEGHVFQMPVAHAEGRFATRKEGLLEDLLYGGQVVFRYCTKDGEIPDGFPVNPNGSVLNIAGISNPRGNVVAMMPHPERCSWAYQLQGKPFGGEPFAPGPGVRIFESMREYIEGGHTIVPPGVREYAEPIRLESGECERASGDYSIRLFVDLIITDNEAATIRRAIQRGFPALEGLRRQTYWGIELEGQQNGTDFAGELIRSGELLNTNKEEALVKFPDGTLLRYDRDNGGFSPGNLESMGRGLYEFRVLVEDTEDFEGMSKRANLRNRFGFSNIAGVRSGKLWTLGLRAENEREAGKVASGIRARLNAWKTFNSYLQDNNMITKVRLKNWKSHLDSEFVFDRGVNCLVGTMGSGKSSIMHAVSFALFGTFPFLQSRKVALNDVIMKKPQRKTHAVVELEFVLNGNTYYVKRVVESGKGTTEAEIRENGRILDVNASGVTAEVERILQMDYELFSKAVYSEQDWIDYFLRIPKGQRMQHIDRMLKVDRFDDVREAAVKISNQIKQKGEEKSRIVAELEKEDLGRRISEIEKELSGMRESAETIEKRAGELRKEKDRLQSTVSALEKKEQELNEIKRLLEGVRGSLEEVEAGIRQKTGFIEGMDRSQLGLETKELKGLLKEKRENADKLRGSIHALEERKRLVIESVEGLEMVEGKCPLCDSRIPKDKKEHLLEHRKKEVEDIDSETPRLQEEMEGVGREMEKIEGEIRAKELDIERIQAAVSELDEVKRKREALGRRDNALRGEEKRLGAEIAGFDTGRLRDELQSKVAGESRVSAELAGVKDRISDKTETLEELRNREGMLNRYREEVRRDEKNVERIASFVKVLKITQDQLREEFLKNVNYIMNRVWNELYPYGDFREIMLTVEAPTGRRAGDYVLQLKEKGGWVSVEGIASGGERSIASLALRVAFSLTFIPNLKWLILDEPTHNLDRNAIRHFADILKERLGFFAEQVVLITHEEGLSEGVTGSLYKLERDKTNDGPTQVAGG
jgi:phosphoribosylformylglycinamidine synthase I